ncbi:MAG: ABC transporter permease subunit [Phycisphaerales bacterium]|nr:ABC transporter permease [Phycisphaerae bacterium]NNF42835.1 ABC transporter permease subunit [Phycisphaerales bacterium]NNM25404.1 ABC transporter permease subunit [Phycisphaerales bacterium]
MRVFGAMLVDAYRELNSKRLFWVILGLSAFVTIVYGSIGFDDDGMSMFFGLVNIDNPMLSRDSLISSVLYRSIFTTFMIGLWLAWVATILALISTATIFPDFIAGGSIDMVLSKPVRRPTLFAMKYVVSLLFVLLQVTIFCLGVFLCMGLRLGDWEWKVFAAIPIVTVFFSYLYSISVLVGVWTRSALTALLVTMLVWFSLFSVNMAEGVLYQERTKLVIRTEESDRLLDSLDQRLEALPNNDAAAPVRARVEAEQETALAQRTSVQDTIDQLDDWYRPIKWMQAVMPKTGETIGLLDRWLARDTDVNLMDIMAGTVEIDASTGDFETRDTSADRESLRRRLEEDAEKSLWYIVGTSLVFEAVLLLAAGLIFVRRDY